MAKAKKQQKPGKKRTVAKRKAGSTFRGFTSPMRTLLDPCAGPLESYYPGERGMVQRFTLDATINATAGLTAGFVHVIPAAGQWLYYAAATSIATGTPTAQTGPGQIFLAANAAKFRPVAACVTVIPSAVSVTNITGEIAAAVVSANTLSTTTTSFVDGVFQLAQARSVLAKREYEIKWYPGTLDSTYAPAVSGTATLADQADQNAVLVAYRGYPAGTSLSLRITVILEWTPVQNIGTAVSSAPRAGTNVTAHAAALHEHQSSWWHNLKTGFMDDLGSAARYVGRTGLYKGAKWVEGKLGGAAAEMALALV